MADSLSKMSMTLVEPIEREFEAVWVDLQQPVFPRHFNGKPAVRDTHSQHPVTLLHAALLSTSLPIARYELC